MLYLNEVEFWYHFNWESTWNASVNYTTYNNNVNINFCINLL